MTRQEEINVAASKYGYIAISDYKDAFIEGADWADSHPVNVWHDAREEPRSNELLLGEDTDGFSIYRWCGQEDNWEAFVNETGLSRWAYIDDLLPKGGKK